ncbi:hypothetical protein M2324_001823 [Rhodovulum sulfidophilum]|nr:hypothetical protein [Rhodovulum sulfidophilum]
MSKPSPASYRTTNWFSYNASLRKRGSPLLWVEKDMTWLATGGLVAQSGKEDSLRACIDPLKGLPHATERPSPCP